jgi:hypothetical protein
MNALYHAAPKGEALLCELGQRGGNLGSATAALLRLLDEYGARALDEAVTEALAQDTPHPHAVRQVLERRRRERGQPPPIAVVLPHDPRLMHLSVRPHRLDTYDHLEPARATSEEPPDER